MWAQSLFLASVALVAAQSDESTSAVRPRPTSTTDEPCGIVASAAAAFETAIPAQTAFECLDSVPVDVQGNSKLIDELKLVWQWQSEISWLKNPPAEWEWGPIDIEKELDNVKANLESFSSEYAVQLAIQNITIRTGNYHFNYQPDILQIFSFYRLFSVVSISEDGKALPKLYEFSDATLLNVSSDVSEITAINGVEAFEYLKKLAVGEQYIDTDGGFNSLLAKGDTLTKGAFYRQTNYDGASTNVTFANGTSVVIESIAEANQDFTGVFDGQSFFENFCTGSISGMSPEANAKTSLDPKSNPGHLGHKPLIPHHINYLHKRQEIPSSGYADAVVEDDSGAIAGYFLNGNGYDNVAVLKIITFAPESDATGDNFQAAIQKFLAKCISEKKEKLIIDLRENGGGATHLLLDAFMQLFPEQEPFSGQRYRATEEFISIGNVVEAIHKNDTLERRYERWAMGKIEETYRYWAYWEFETPKGETWGSFDDFDGPYKLNSDNFTSLMRYNYSNDNLISVIPPGFAFLNSTSRPTPFQASNIVMYTDALCGSACVSFHEELKNIAGVKSITVGGRAETGPIQVVAGTKGGEVIPLYFYPYYASTLINITEELRDPSLLPSQKVKDLASVEQVLIRAGDASSRVQSQDQIRKGDTSATPLQFIYEAADCKIFYTASTFADPDAAWKQAWDAFQDDTKCVEGSTAHKSAISGGWKPFGASEVKDENLPDPSGSGSTTDENAVAGQNGNGDKKGAASGLRVGSVMVAVGLTVVMAFL
ncbi:hypothetical protein BDV95DRAFT_606042 [Massariosphaeria phaeospora]|uniref:Uncharacterized protein n=1 Tax=Massariosphaeria phaeospora TaxID=100035 RepID=A0A7C8I971_9PLEO|nr:hypothetical protein BDV95DRAFT_606042 [Massariosphaeria phaeospora]